LEYSKLNKKPGVLDGIRIIDMGHAAVGPQAGCILAQMGADVIKVEPPTGDIIHQSPTTHKGLNTLYIVVNASKRGVVFDLKKEKQREIFYKLIKTADAYLDNMRPDAAARIGIDYETLKKINPCLIYVNSSGFGAKGPLSKMGSYDPYGEAFGGHASVVGAPGGRPELSRMAARTDLMAAQCVANAVLIGLYVREKTGKGQKIDTSQMQSSVHAMTTRTAEYFVFGQTPKPMGNGHPSIVPSQAFKTKDGYFAVSVLEEKQWEGLCKGIARPDLAQDHRFASNAMRVEHREELIRTLGEIFAGNTAENWLKLLEKQGVPCGMFLRYRDMREDPHIMGTGMLEKLNTRWGMLTIPPIPIKFSEAPIRFVSGPAPGEHTDEILRDLGYGPEDASRWLGPPPPQM